MKTKKKDKRNKAEKANKMDIKKMTALAMFSVIALTIFTAESMIGSNCTNSRNQAWTSQYRNTSCTGFIWTKGSSICADRANPSWKHVWRTDDFIFL